MIGDLVTNVKASNVLKPEMTGGHCHLGQVSPPPVSVSDDDSVGHAIVCKHSTCHINIVQPVGGSKDKSNQDSNLPPAHHSQITKQSNVKSELVSILP